MFISLFFSLLRRGRLRLSFLSFGRHFHETVSPQPTTTAADAAERVISRDVDEVEVIPKRRRGRGILPPPAGPRRGWEGSDSVGAGGRMARGARFALAASNPPPPRGRRQCSGGHTPLYTQGGKSCKKNPRHSVCAPQPHRPLSLFYALPFLPPFPLFNLRW